MPIPRVKPKPWYATEFWPAAITVAGVGISGVVGLVREIVLQRRSQTPDYGTTAVLVVGACVAIAGGLIKVAQSRHKDSKDKKTEGPEDLQGGLLVILSVVAGHKNIQGEPPDGWLRLTIHNVVDNQKLEQSVDYVGSNHAGAGRELPIQTGLIGKAARNGRPHFHHRPLTTDLEKWLTYLVDDQAMTLEQAKSVRSDRYSFMTVPLTIGGAVRAIVYLDTTELDFFDPSTQAVVMAACFGLASWVSKRYT